MQQSKVGIPNYMSTSNPAAALLLRLGYDGSDAKKGLSQSRQDVATFKAQAVLLEEELKRERTRLATDFTAENRKQAETRVTDVRAAIGKEIDVMRTLTGAQQDASLKRINQLRAEFGEANKNLGQFDAQAKKVKELADAYNAARTNASKSQAAAGVFRETGRASGEIPGLSDLLQNVAPGLANIQSRLGGILNSLVILGGGLQGASQGFDAMAASGAGLGETLGGLLGTTTLIGGAIIAIGGAAFAAALNVGEWSLEMSNLSQKTGISTEALVGFEHIGNVTGLSVDTLMNATRSLSKSMVTDSAVFGHYSVDIRDKVTGAFRDEKDVLLDLADVFAQMPDGPEKVRLANELLGRSGQELIPTLNLGRKALQEIFDEGVRLGPNIAQNAAAYAKWKDATADLSLEMKGLEGHLSGIVRLGASGIDAVNNVIEAAKTAASKSGGLGGPGFLGNLGLDLLGVGDVQAPNLPKKLSAPRPPVSLNPFLQTENDPAVLALQQKIQEADRKSLSIKEQLTQEQKRLNDAQKAYNDLNEADKQKGGFKDEIKANLQEQLEIKDRINALDKEQASAAKAAATAESERLKLLKETADIETEIARTSSNLKSQASVINEGISATVKLMQQQAEYQRLQKEASAIDPSTKEGAAQLKANEEKQNSLEKETAAIALKQMTDAAKEDRAKKIALENKLLIDQIALLDRIVSIDQLGLRGTPQPLQTSTGTDPFQDLMALGGAGGKLSRTRAQGGLIPEKPSEIQGALKSLQDFGDIVAKFNGGLSKQFSEMFAGVESFTKGFEQLQKSFNKNGEPGGGISSAIGGIKQSFSQGGLSGVLSGITSIGDIAAGAVGFVGSIISGISDLFSAHAKKIAENIKDEVAAIDGAFKAGNLTVTSAISATEAQKTYALNNLSGDRLQQVLDQINQELVALRAQQKATLDSFNAELAKLKAPVGIGDFNSSFVQIIQTLRTASAAGASLTDQLAYLNLSVTQLATNLNGTLRSAEQSTLSLLRQDIALQQQKADLQISYDEQRRAILSSVGLAPVLTPGQQIAQQLADLDRQHKEQVDANNEQQDQLTAQLDGQAQLYGFSVKITDLESEKNAVIAQQLLLQKQITAESTTQLTQQLQLLAMLHQGQIPNLQAGLLPTGPDFTKFLSLVESSSIIKNNKDVGQTALQATFGTSNPDASTVTLSSALQLIKALTGEAGGPTAGNSTFQLTGQAGATRDALVQELLDIFHQIQQQSFTTTLPTSFVPTLPPSALGGSTSAASLAAWASVGDGGLSGLPNTLVSSGGVVNNNNIAGLTIQVVLPDGSQLTADQAAAIVRNGLTQISKDGGSTGLIL